MGMQDDMMGQVLEDENPMADVQKMGQNSNGRNGYTSSSAHSNEIDSNNSSMSSTVSATVSATVNYFNINIYLILLTQVILI